MHNFQFRGDLGNPFHTHFGSFHGHEFYGSDFWLFFLVIVVVLIILGSRDK